MRFNLQEALQKLHGVAQSFAAVDTDDSQSQVVVLQQQITAAEAEAAEVAARLHTIAQATASSVSDCADEAALRTQHQLKLDNMIAHAKTDATAAVDDAKKRTSSLLQELKPGDNSTDSTQILELQETKKRLRSVIEASSQTADSAAQVRTEATMQILLCFYVSNAFV